MRLRFRPQLPIYRFEDEYGDGVWALRKPWYRKFFKAPTKYTQIYSTLEDENILKRERVIGPSVVAMPDTSQFSTMLMQASRRWEGRFFRDDPEDWGFDWESGLSREAREAHDYFLDQSNPKAYWLEDELMPRMRLGA